MQSLRTAKHSHYKEVHGIYIYNLIPKNTNPQQKAPPGVYKCNHPRCLTCPFLQEDQTKYIFSATNEKRRINDNLNCKSKNLIYLIECKKCTKQYIGETKRQLHEHFGEHRRSIQNHHQFIKPTPQCVYTF